MPRKHSHPAAMKLAGDLYGKILNRNADKGGFEYVLDSLQHGKKSVRQHALEMVHSDEFANKFVRGREHRSVVLLLNKVLLGRRLDDRLTDVETQYYRNTGLKAYAEDLIQSPDYWGAYGEDNVPGAGH